MYGNELVWAGFTLIVMAVVILYISWTTRTRGNDYRKPNVPPTRDRPLYEKDRKNKTQKRKTVPQQRRPNKKNVLNKEGVVVPIFDLGHSTLQQRSIQVLDQEENTIQSTKKNKGGVMLNIFDDLEQITKSVSTYLNPVKREVSADAPYLYINQINSAIDHEIFEDDELRVHLNVRGNPRRSKRMGEAITMSGNFSLVAQWMVGNKRKVLHVPLVRGSALEDLIKRLEVFKRYASRFYFFVNYQIIYDGLIIEKDGVKYIVPVILEDWVPGEHLHAFVCEAAKRGDSEKIKAVKDELERLQRYFKYHNIVHGDLCGENILVVEDRNNIILKVIDYDSVQVPQLKGVPPLSSGHENYKVCIEDKGANADDDFFSISLAALGILEERPHMAESVCDEDDDYDDDRLIFRAVDFRKPSKSRIFRSIRRMRLSSNTKKRIDVLYRRAMGCTSK